LGGNKRSFEGLEALLELKDIFFFAHFMLLDERADPIPHFPFLVFQGSIYFQIFLFFLGMVLDVLCLLGSCSLGVF
jgi:hypothetical protein